MFAFLAKLLRTALFFRQTSFHFFRSALYLLFTIGLIWGIALIFPGFAQALGMPCTKVWECVSAAGSALFSRPPTPQLVVTAPPPTTAPAKPAPAPAPPAPAAPQPPAPAPKSEWQRVEETLNESWGKDWPRTIRTLEAFLAREPGHSEAKSKLNGALVSEGDLLLKSGDRGGAEERFRKAAALNTPDGTAKARLEALNPPPPPPPVAASKPAAQPQAPAPAPPVQKPRSGFLGRTYAGDWCRQVHDGTIFDNIWSFPQSEGFYCVTMRGDHPVDINDVCRRAFNHPQARGRRDNATGALFSVDCTAP